MLLLGSVNTLYLMWLRGGTSIVVDQSQQNRPDNQSEQTGLWFQTEGERRCCSTDSMRKIKSFLNIKAWRHVPVETLHTNMNLKMSIKGSLKPVFIGKPVAPSLAHRVWTPVCISSNISTTSLVWNRDTAVDRLSATSCFDGHVTPLLDRLALPSCLRRCERLSL